MGSVPGKVEFESLGFIVYRFTLISIPLCFKQWKFNRSILPGTHKHKDHRRDQ